jgi:hypothetical protein
MNWHQEATSSHTATAIEHAASRANKAKASRGRASRKLRPPSAEKNDNIASAGYRIPVKASLMRHKLLTLKYINSGTLAGFSAIHLRALCRLWLAMSISCSSHGFFLELVGLKFGKRATSALWPYPTTLEGLVTIYCRKIYWTHRTERFTKHNGVADHPWGRNRNKRS